MGSISKDRADTEMAESDSQTETASFKSYAFCGLQRKPSEETDTKGILSEEENGESYESPDPDFDYLELKTAKSNEEKSVSERSSGNSSENETSEEWDPENDTESNYSSTDLSFDWNDSGSDGSFLDERCEEENSSDEGITPVRPPHRLLFECVLSACITGPFEPDSVRIRTCMQRAFMESFPEKDLTKKDVNEIHECMTEMLDKCTTSRLSKCSVYSIVVQELSNDLNSEKFALFVQYFHDGQTIVELLAYLKSGTDKDVAERIQNELNKFGIDLTKVISVGSDGAPVMWKSEMNVFSMLKMQAPKIMPVLTNAEYVTHICRHAISKSMDLVTSYCRLLPVIFHRTALDMRDRRSKKVATVIEDYLESYMDPRWVSWETSYDGLKALMLSYRAIVSLLWGQSFDEDDDNEIAFVQKHVSDPGSDLEDNDDVGLCVAEYTVPAFTAVFIDILIVLNKLKTGLEESSKKGLSYTKDCFRQAKESFDELTQINGCNYGEFLSSLKAEAGWLIYDKVKLRKLTASEFVDKVRLELISAVSDCLTKLIPEETLEVFEAFCIIEPSRLPELTDDEECKYVKCLSQQFGQLVDSTAVKSELQKVKALVKDKDTPFTEFATQLVSLHREKFPQTCRLAEIALCLPVKFLKGEEVHKARCESVVKLGELDSEELTTVLRIATCQDLYKNWKYFPVDETFDNWQSKKFANEEELLKWLAETDDDSD